MKINIVISSLLLMLVANFAYAKGDVVVVDMGGAIYKSDKGRLAFEKLKASFAHEEADLMTLQAELKELQMRRDKDSAIMSNEERLKIEKEGAEKVADFQHQAKKLKKKGKDAEQSLIQSILPDVQRAIKSLTEENKYALILRKEIAIHVDASRDITDEVVAKMNQQ
ncbi:hypothetical protein A9Q99_23030 [Gammaproteobacteria bacterium 45_16_T64]|nr:hypothetical protein A9Q99_23030 [Gammaproteobacteria bacterium 45_16_T64]